MIGWKNPSLKAPRLFLGLNGHLPDGVEVLEHGQCFYLFSGEVYLCRSFPFYSNFPGCGGYVNHWRRDETFTDEEKQIVIDVVSRAKEKMDKVESDAAEEMAKRRSDAVKAMVEKPI